MLASLVVLLAERGGRETKIFEARTGKVSAVSSLLLLLRTGIDLQFETRLETSLL